MSEDFTELCKKLEHFETPEWAAKAILNKEVMPQEIVDPCTGTGILARVLRDNGHSVMTFDIHDWGYPVDMVEDWLKTGGTVDCKGLMMNPPFSLSTNFVEHAFKCGFTKILCFQRFAWWESKRRKEFWEKYPPSRVYICGDRATSWRHDIPQHQRLDDKGREKTTPTAHAWFVWDRESPAGTLLGHIYREDA